MPVSFFKVPPVKSRKYLDSLRDQPCVVSGRNNTEPAHLRLNQSAGMSQKPQDHHALPLNWELHRDQSQHGEGFCWLMWARERPEFLARLANEFPELYFRWLLSIAEARFEAWKRA